ncbi:uncharacterized protein LOC134778186 [Penaeus indicus]|uniref:uncharacterized protein LOC134778186 n=1 Tax=Penaeus indicus TaxID=29960 RepID=UPI00300CCC0F
MYALSRHLPKQRFWAPCLLPATRNPLRQRDVCLSANGIDTQNDVKWLHPVGSSVEKMNVAATHSQLNLIASLTLRSAVPVSAAHFHQALVHLQRKVASLRTCFRQRDQALWLCEMMEPQIDFQVIKNADLETEIDKLIVKPFAKPAVEPVWLARLLQTPDEPSYWGPEVKDFPHQYNFLFFFHHGAVDGISGLLILAAFQKLLEDVVIGTYIDQEQYGRLGSEEQTMQLERETLDKLESNPEEFQRLVDEAAGTMSTPLINQAFGTPAKEEFPTRILQRVFKAHQLRTLQGRCRSHGITVNSALASVINTALVELVAEAGLERDAYTITSQHAINKRRYWKGDSSTVLGNHVGPMSHTMHTPRGNRKNFWAYAKRFDAEFRQKLKEGYIFQEKIIRSKLLPEGYSHEAWYSSPPPTVYDYFMTNIVIPHKFDHGTGKVIRLTEYRNLCNISRCDYPMIHMLSDISQEDVNYTLMYATGRLSHDTAQAFLDKIMDVLSYTVK